MNLNPAITTPQKHSNQLCRATRQDILSLSSGIATGHVSLVTLEREVSLTSAINSPTIRSAFRGNDEVAYSVVHVLVKRFLGAFTFSTKLEPSQVESFTVDTLEHFEYETLDDIVLFFKMARSGKLGVAKKGIDSNTVFGEWYQKYLELKAEAREKDVQAKKIAVTTTPVTMEDIKKTYAVADEKKKELERQTYIDKLVLNMDRQMLEDTITTWEQDPKFSRLLKLLKKKRKTIK